MLEIIKSRKIWYTLSTLFLILGIVFIVVKGVRFGIDFTGGSLLEISYTQERVSPEQINEVVSAQGVESVVIQAVDEKGYVLRMPELPEEQRRAILVGLREQIGQNGEEGEAVNELVERRFESIGPVIGQELKSKSVKAIIIVLIAILAYVAWAFRKVSRPVQSWKYGIVALVTLFHDVIITFGVFTMLTHAFGWEINSAFVAAILTILGYSVNDTIVVFDRIRENVPRLSGSFAETINTSVNQTISRSINTSLTTSLVLLAIMIFGGASIKGFVVALIIGVIIGTYSSIFIASPLLVTWQLYGKKRKK